MFPCRCEFDNEADFIKYGEVFSEIVGPSQEPLSREALTKLFKQIDSWPSQPRPVTTYYCNRCGHLQYDAVQCGMCEWGDLYEQRPKKNFLRRLLDKLRR